MVNPLAVMALTSSLHRC